MKKLILFLFTVLSVLPLLTSQQFVFDPGHTFIQFSVNRFGAIDVKGRFNDFSGTLTFDEATQMISDADFTIEVGSIDTGHEVRDGHLKGGIWLDAENYPQINFNAKSISKSDEGYSATGELTIHGVTNEVEIPFTMSGPAIDPTKTNTIGISTELTINRQDYGIAFSRMMDNGKLFIGNDVKIQIEALAMVPKG